MRNLLFVILLLCTSLTSSAQRFFNLTADEVAIDSLLPRFDYSIPLEGNFADSLYNVSILYPEFIDMSERDKALFDSISGGKSLPELPIIEQTISFSRRQGTLDISFLPLVERDEKKQILVSFMLRVDSQPKDKTQKRNQLKADTPRNQYKDHSVLASGRWAKIRVPASGYYQLTEALVNKAGFSDVNKVKIYGYGGNLQNEKLVSEELMASDDLKELETSIIGGRRVFYAKGPVSWENRDTPRRTRNPYSDYGYYFITQEETAPTIISQETLIADTYPSNDDYHSLREIDNFAWYHGGRNLYESTPIESGNAKEFTIDVPSGNAKGKLYVCLTSRERGTATITLNDSIIGTLNFATPSDIEEARELTITKDVLNLKETNSVSIASSGSTLRLDHISIAFDNPRPLPDLSAATLPVPEYVHNITNQDLHAHQQADMVIIIPTSQKLRSQAERLAAFHESNDGLKINIVPADELYNEFSSGTPDANAYRRYLKMLYDRAETENELPRYLLLFGDGAFDNRMKMPEWSSFSVDDFLLCFESENSLSHFDCYVNDGWFGLLDEGEGGINQASEKVDIGVGRFPVRTEEEARILTDKTIDYLTNKNAGDWQNTLMFMGDDDPKVGNYKTHMADIDEVAEVVINRTPAFLVKKVMWDAYTKEATSTGSRYPDVENIVKQQQTAGALVMNYAGHGSETSMSHERVLVLDDFINFQNENLPLWVINACDIMPFDANMSTIGEAAVLNKKGGAVAVYSTSRTVYADRNLKMNKLFTYYSLSVDNDGKPMRLGDAVRLSKNNISKKDNNSLHYHLLGDPALTLKLPEYEVVIDSINGIDIKDINEKEKFPKLKAGTISHVKAHIEHNGTVVSDFNGTMTATVRDTKETIICKNNLPEFTGSPFTFTDRTKTLYNGSDAVVDGKINFTFAVPLDINYADDLGQIIIFASSNDKKYSAHGVTEKVIVGGTGEMSNDSIGPSIYCYLNSPFFIDGGNVNSTPYFVAELKDSDGINASGIGIGHDMELIIDGEMARTYSLNDNFRFDYGSFTSGSTYYFIPELEEGRHQLKFRAWDVQNNSSTATLSFNVIKGLEPSLCTVDCTNNPASENTTFIVSHDRIGSNVEVDLELYDTSGRLLWRHQEQDYSNSSTFTYNWDLTIDGGQRLQTGVYLYRVLVGSGGTKKTSKAKKLIIISNN